MDRNTDHLSHGTRREAQAPGHRAHWDGRKKGWASQYGIERLALRGHWDGGPMHPGRQSNTAAKVNYQSVLPILVGSAKVPADALTSSSIWQHWHLWGVYLRLASQLQTHQLSVLVGLEASTSPLLLNQPTGGRMPPGSHQVWPTPPVGCKAGSWYPTRSRKGGGWG
ncbi:hypothetical protein HD554DRAFT_2327512 [Boletus coccyginus]|nr:hypothetical protein HD554DRAFT_2327512 [Boletus coccyginus]